MKLGQIADVVDGPQEVESLALYNGTRTLALDVQKAQGENTIDVVDGLNRVVDELDKDRNERVRTQIFARAMLYVPCTVALSVSA